jgi:hypothetical protein
MTRRRWTALAAALLSGCVPVVYNQFDRQTSLEQQAAGSYPALSRELDGAGLQPGAVPLTHEQAAGDSTAASESDAQSDVARVDEYLVRQCLGEGRDGVLADRKETCQGKPEQAEVLRVMERANRRRQQVWQWLAKQAPNEDAAKVRAAWRATRLREVVCGAPIQNDDGTWETKKC